MSYGSVKQRIFELAEKNTEKDPFFEIFNTSILILILLNIGAIILESFEGFHSAYNIWFYRFEFFSVVVFSIEYCMRVWISDLLYPGTNRFAARMKYIFSPMALVDLAAIMPFYLPLLFRVDLRFLRMLRLMRLFRIFKIHRYTTAIDMIVRVFKKQKEDLIVTIVAAFFVVLISSTLMFYLEHDAQPKAFPNIIATFWWAVATLTTVGYGDVYPITGYGKVLSGFIAIIGIGLVALPTGIISSGFIDELHSRKGEEKKKAAEFDVEICPCCGRKMKEKGA